MDTLAYSRPEMARGPSTAAQAALPGATAEHLFAGFETRQLAKGCLFSTPSDACNRVLIVKSGRLRVYLTGESRDLSLSFLEVGDVYATHTPTYIEAVVPSVVGLMNTPDFARRLATDPSVTPVMMRVMGRMLANAVNLIEDLAFREVPARLGRFLLGLARRRGMVSDAGLLIPLDLSLEDIASLLGTTRQTVSALINQWEREGLIQRQSRHSLLIRSWHALGERCAERLD